MKAAAAVALRRQKVGLARAAGAALLAMLAACGALALNPARSAAQTFSPCMNSPEFSCASLQVPLDRSGGPPGSITLAVERRLAGSQPSETAVVALAGGPGQAAIPLAQDAEQAMAPALGTRDLIVFDQRGTGASGPLQCSALEGSAPLSIASAFERCAQQIGPARGAYITQESVADIETLRQALGYRRLVLFGVSYGTKVALEYAESHPSDVEALVLDSVVPTGVSDPFSLATFKAIGPVLSELCSHSACAHITRNPTAGLARLDGIMRKHPLKGWVYDGFGHRHRASMTSPELLNLLLAGDLNPALRALLPASVQSALHGDPAPLLRLKLLSEGLVPNVPVPHARAARNPHARAARNLHAPAARNPHARAARSTGPVPHAALPSASGGVDEALFADTTCEEAPFPWQRSASPATREREALAALHALPGSAFYPFDPATDWAEGLLTGCAHWPNAAPAPPAAGPLPDVPTLLLSGGQDLRTPTSNARKIAQRIPGAQLLVVPFTGHSVLGSDFSGCAQAAVKSFFSGAPPQPCTHPVNLFSPTPVAPTSLSHVRPVGGLRGRPGSTLAVVLNAILDLERQVIGARLQAEQELPKGSRFGGLRGGYARLSPSRLELHQLSFVPGVQLSGTFAISHGKLLRSTVRVAGRAAAHGAVQVGGTPVVSGTLGRVRFSIELSHVKLATASAAPPAAPASGTPALGTHLPHPALAHAR